MPSALGLRSRRSERILRPETSTVNRIRRAGTVLSLAIAAMMAASASVQADTLQAGDNLHADESVWSSDGRYQIRYQSDGNLVLYRANGSALWATYTFGAPGAVRMQGDGNFVVYDDSGTPLWSSNTDGNPGAFLKVQNDGNVVIYRADGVALWSTGTVQAEFATFIYPTNGDPAADLSQPLRWTTVNGAQAYYLYVGTAPGAKNLVDTGEIQQTSFLAPGLAAGATLYATIWTKYSGIWSASSISFTVATSPEPATFTAPSNGVSNVDLSQPFQWTAVSGAEAYYLYVGTGAGLKNLVDTGEIQQTSYAATSLPSNQTLYARIWTRLSGIWYYSDISFSGAARGTLTYPENGSTSADLSQAFQWTAVSGAEAYYLYVGTQAGLKDLVDTGEIQQISYRALGLPSNQTLYARIWTKIAGVWYYADSEFSGIDRATFTDPIAGATNVDLTQPIQWTSVAGAQAYYLYVGTAAGLKDRVDTGEIQQTSYAASNLPAGETLHARIWTNVAGTWYYSDISFSGNRRATLMSPANGASNIDLLQPLQWTTVPGAEAYYLYVGTAAGLRNLVDTGEIQQTSYTATNLPAGQPLYARIWTKLSGTWYYSDSSFSGFRKAVFTFPADGATNGNPTTPIQWTAVDGAQAYYLYVGTAVGLKNLVDTGEIQQTSHTASNLPAGQTLYARIWTKLSGTWYYSDITFSRAQGTAILTYPTNGATDIALPISFQWTTVSGAQAYYLYVGTQVGLKDRVDTGEIQQTSYSATNLPSGQTLYARIWTKVGGVWSFSDSAFSTGSSECAFSMSASAADIADAGVFDISTGPGCEWSLVTNSSAVALDTHAGVGSISVGFSFDRSALSAGTAQIDIAGMGDPSQTTPPWCFTPPPPCPLDSPLCAPPIQFCLPPIGRFPQPRPIEPTISIVSASLEAGTVTVRVFGDSSAHELIVFVRGKTFSTLRRAIARSQSSHPPGITSCSLTPTTCGSGRPDSMLRCQQPGGVRARDGI